MTCPYKENILLFSQRVPRYTSYPTALQFSEIDSVNVYAQELGNIPDDASLSLYLHVPFCPKLCWYCGCHTKITRRYAPVEDYAYLLMREIEITASYLSGRQTVRNIHFGGGSPGMLRAQDFDLVMKKLYGCFNIAENAEIAIEIDPRNVSEGRVATYAKHGVNRISLGVQDFNEKVLKAVNRQQPFHLSHKAVKLFREYGIDHINMDVMYGLPHQSLSSMHETFEKILYLDPQRIAFFGYAHVPWMKKHMRLIEEGALPDKDLRYDLSQAGHNFFEAAGYVPIGIDHFTKPDDALNRALRSQKLRRNFQGYTTDQADALIGLGASSIGQVGGDYYQNFPDMGHYKKAVLGNKLPVKKQLKTTTEDRLRAAVIERLMCYFEVDIAEICDAYGFDESCLDDALQSLETYRQYGFLQIEERKVIINTETKLMARIISSAFDSYINQSNNQMAEEKPCHADAI